MVLFNRGYSTRARAKSAIGASGGSAPDLAGYAKKSDVAAAILNSESNTNVIKQDVDTVKASTDTVINNLAVVEAVVGKPPRNFVLADDFGDVRLTSKGGSIGSLFSIKGIVTSVPRTAPAARTVRSVATLDISPLTDETEHAFLQGRVEASGTGVPADGYAFYRYDDSNINDGLNSRVEIEMPKKYKQGVYIWSRSHDREGEQLRFSI
jgi:hypothetical protein